MLKAGIKVFVLSITVFSWVACDNYEFPKSPYPRIETLPVVNISETGVTFQANITKLGDKEIINHGFVWGLKENLSINAEDKIQLGATSSLGNFEAEVNSGFYEGQTYFVRSFIATDSYFVYGKAVSFTSKGSTPPVIESFSPLEGTWGDTITIRGNYFSALPKNNIVKFGSLDSKVVASNDSTILCIVPDNVEDLLVSVYVQVTANTAEATQKFQLTVPQIDDFTPTSGTFLDEVIINGSNFGVLKTHVVTVGGKVAEVVSFSRTSLKVKIPWEVDLKTNEIKLVLNQQTATAATSFTMLPPAITSLSAAEGRIGDEVEIAGENFNPRLLGNMVLLGESQATVVSAERQLLKVKLTNGVYPERINPIKVTVVEQTATSGPFKLLDPWLKKGYTPTAEISGGGFELGGNGYFVAGNYLYSYDPFTNNWTQKADFPGVYRFNPSSFATGSYGYSGIGGAPCCSGGPLVDLWRYSPTSNSWLRRSDYPIQSSSAIGTGVGAKGYVVDGFVTVFMHEYDPGTNSWARVGADLDARFTGYPHFPYSIFAMDDRLFVFFRQEYNYTSEDNYLYEFHVASGTWTRRAAYFDERSVGFSINGTGYIAGFKYVHEYNLTTNVMTLNRIPLPNNYWGIEYLFTADNRAYFLGAWANHQYELWEFDPSYLQ